MAGSIRIAIRVPGGDNTRDKFAIRLKKSLEKESGIYHTMSKIVFLNGSLGNFNDMLENMTQCGIIDEKLNWVFGDGHAVITGNCLNGSEESTRLLWLIYALESKAIKGGGYLHFIPGPLEIMHDKGSWRSLQPAYASSARPGSSHRYVALFDGNNELFRWLQTKNIVEKIGDITILQSNLATGYEDYLPKFRGRRFPDSAKEILRLSLDEITEARLQDLHKSFDTARLMIVDAHTGRIITSVQDPPDMNIDMLPLLYNNGKYHHLQMYPGNPSVL